eukprot:TsM_000420000 transcript=TsM_000420000 gene=TsM_000420000
MRFGELHYRRGVITYSISPYEVNAFKGFISQGFPNFVRRFREKFLVVAGQRSRRSCVRRFGVKKQHGNSGNHRGSEEAKLTKDVSTNSEKRIIDVLLVAVVRWVTEMAFSRCLNF